MIATFHLYIIVLCTALTLLYRHLTRNFHYWKNRNVPYMRPALLFGNVYSVCKIQESLSQFLCNTYHRTKSPYFGFFVFDQPFLLLKDPALIKQCLIKNFDCFSDRSIKNNMRDDELGSNVIFSLKNPTWKNIRTQLTPIFSTGKVKSMLPLLVAASDDLVNYLKKTSVQDNYINARETSMKFTTDVISSCAFGVNAECFKYEDSPFRVAARRMFDLNFGRKIQMASYFFAPMLVDLLRMKLIEKEAGLFMVNVFTKIMTERERSNFHRGDVIDTLIEIKKKNKNAADILNGPILVAQAVNFFNAGFETSGSTISFALYHLSLKQLIQERLRKEIRDILNKYGEITYEAINDMIYLDMVISETLRLYPVLAFLDRRCTKTHQLEGSDLVIEEGIPVYISLLGLHSDPQYFPNPADFDPERFAPENKRNIPNFCYMPFGEGPRNCIGARFGLLTVKVGLLRILNEFQVEPTECTPVPLTLDPNGMVLAPQKTLYLHFMTVK